MTAVERSAELLALAKRRALYRGATVRFAHADMTTGWAPMRPADGVLCRGVLNDVMSNDARERAFVAFASWLGPGGIFFLMCGKQSAPGSATRMVAISRGRRPETMTRSRSPARQR